MSDTTERDQNILRSAEIVLKDLYEGEFQEKGADTLSRLYYVLGNPNDPVFELKQVFSKDFTAGFAAGYASGWRPERTTIGIATITTLCRHLNFTELQERRPELVERIRSTHNFNLEQAERYYMEAVLTVLPHPQLLPPEAHVSALSMSVVMKDQSSYMVIKGDHDDTQYVGSPSDLDEYGNPGELYLFLNGLNPGDADSIKNVRQTVEDYQMLQAIEAMSN